MTADIPASSRSPAVIDRRYSSNSLGGRAAALLRSPSFFTRPFLSTTNKGGKHYGKNKTDHSQTCPGSPRDVRRRSALASQRGARPHVEQSGVSQSTCRYGGLQG